MYGCLIKVYRLLALMSVLADATRACAIPVLSDATATVWCLHWYFHTSAESQKSMLLALLLKNRFSSFELENLGTRNIIILLYYSPVLFLGSTFVVHVIFNMPSLSAASCSREYFSLTVILQDYISDIFGNIYIFWLWVLQLIVCVCPPRGKQHYTHLDLGKFRTKQNLKFGGHSLLILHFDMCFDPVSLQTLEFFVDVLPLLSPSKLHLVNTR